MDYLKPAFDSFLNEQGTVEIAGYSFCRDTILREMESVGYNEAFLEWCERRKANNLSRAEEILEQFDSNSARFRKLKEIYGRGAITPFVGAGMSKPSGYPGWTGFLYRVLTETRVPPKDFDQLITNGEYEEAAEALHDDLPAGCFLEYVENEFGADREVSGPVQRLPYLFSGAVITTNFDDVLTKAYSSADLEFNEILEGADAVEFPRILGENKKVLVKLHGKANSSRKRVLTKSEYDRHYESDHALESVIEAISTRSLLFIGCSLTIDRTLACLGRIAAQKGVENIPRHYAFLKLRDDEDRLARRDELARANVYPIWYTDDHDESLEALLEALAQGQDS
ncbi:SIR2 family protein [Marinobacter sp. F4206]|uniref:SIR2 family protein n=1 Tax=Marinobacter sp. F4206 TaxID=2861777 RepID=UPI001C5E54C7|nr:SIR2 family protein [Marinobacter sp. F4206]MBW4934464.1 SIR2 family protein [Marinobacter sp. F4206]